MIGIFPGAAAHTVIEMRTMDAVLDGATCEKEEGRGYCHHERINDVNKYFEGGGVVHFPI